MDGHKAQNSRVTCRYTWGNVSYRPKKNIRATTGECGIREDAPIDTSSWSLLLRQTWEEDFAVVSVLFASYETDVAW